MKIVIFTNRHKDPGFAVTRAAEAFLREAGADCLLYEGDESVFDGAYAALSLGGDGTFLRCAKLTMPRGVPILGVHLGHTGYLSRIRPEGLENLRHIASFPVRERSALEASIMNGGNEVQMITAVNDFVFSRGMAVQTVSLDLEADGHALGSFLGDGVIVSTALGSTGYALSAGGPVIDPRLDILLVTPICSHTSRTHSFVLASKRTLSVAPSHAERRHIYLSADGGKPRQLEPGESVTVRASDRALLCLEPEGHRFFDNVRIHRL
ncbi:MAG: NAD(+)/NADH kinase [Oscillospiraceae bacterium]|jgi:NAD+ kinase|nr:NAD(+)/NADH kinase [Oscillospiraceae bacterium]